jgi:PAS domain S-box-containing protein
MSRGLLDARALGNREDAFESIGDVLESVTEYSMSAIDPDGVVLLWNEGARRLYGYASAEMIGRSWLRRARRLGTV